MMKEFNRDIKNTRATIEDLKHSLESCAIFGNIYRGSIVLMLLKK